MLIHSASQLLTVPGPPQRGADLGSLGIIPDGAVFIRDGCIRAVGKTPELLQAFPAEERLDARGCVVMPGFVDPHTHVIWAGDRAAEFELRLQGKTYLDILQAGGGILSTMTATRQASIQELVAETLPRLESMFAHGTTTAEAKTGYGLELASELKCLEALLEINRLSPVELAYTFLGAHAIPPEYKDDSDGYTRLLCSEMLPAVKSWWQTHASDLPLPFVDVFCETGAFSLAQSRRILETARELGFPLKLHADEFDPLGGAALAIELGAVSADHLVVTTPDEIKMFGSSTTAAVALPCTPFGLAHQHYTPAKAILEAGGLLAIATDINPGTAWCGSMQFAIALACRYMKLTPAQAIVAATLNAAAALDLHDSIGSLETGKQADLLILDIPDYRHLGYRFGVNLVKTVIKNGQVYPIKGG